MKRLRLLVLSTLLVLLGGPQSAFAQGQCGGHEKCGTCGCEKNCVCSEGKDCTCHNCQCADSKCGCNKEQKK